MSYRDLEQMMAGRGVPVDHIYRWAQRYAPEVEKRMKTAYAAIKGFEVIQGRRSGFSSAAAPLRS
jgi:transposase-like protein